MSPSRRVRAHRRSQNWLEVEDDNEVVLKVEQQGHKNTFSLKRMNTYTYYKTTIEMQIKFSLLTKTKTYNTRVA
jgi:hypothetical protein